jgi:hypothetical protein
MTINNLHINLCLYVLTVILVTPGKCTFPKCIIYNQLGVPSG